MKTTVVALSLCALISSAFAETQPWAPLTPSNVQRPIVFFNSTDHWVTFMVEDDQGNTFSDDKAPIPMLPTIELTKLTPMWHHNITVMAEFHHGFHKATGMACSPQNEPAFGGRYSYVQGYTFVAAKDSNGNLICNAVKL